MASEKSSRLFLSIHAQSLIKAFSEIRISGIVRNAYVLGFKMHACIPFKA